MEIIKIVDKAQVGASLEGGSSLKTWSRVCLDTAGCCSRVQLIGSYPTHV